jgi:hypothetical protein
VALTQPPPFSPLILLSLLTVLGLSAVTMWVLVRRATSHRQWVALSEWAREYGYRFTRAAGGDAPSPFEHLKPPHPVVRLQLSRGPTTLVQFEHGTAPSSGAPTPMPAAMQTPTPAVPTIAASEQPVVWNVLVRQIGSDWRPTGLRPAGATASVLDLFSLSSFPTMGTERFIAYGTDSAAARAVMKSMLRSLLPPDVGLFLHGRHLVLDFSSRPFDAIELSRVVSLSDQVAAHLPHAV